jgi:D-arabinose 1-dehydrogenase-like Zn-dependent alcohol dehydrogenase
MPSPPFVPGHEGVAIVVELAPGVSEVAVGDTLMFSSDRVSGSRGSCREAIADVEAGRVAARIVFRP